MSKSGFSSKSPVLGSASVPSSNAARKSSNSPVVVSGLEAAGVSGAPSSSPDGGNSSAGSVPVSRTVFIHSGSLSSGAGVGAWSKSANGSYSSRGAAGSSVAVGASASAGSSSSQPKSRSDSASTDSASGSASVPAASSALKKSSGSSPSA